MSYHETIQAQRDDYQNHGFVRLPQFFPRATIATFERDITAAVMRLAEPPVKKHLSSKPDTYSQAFTQVMNLWRHDRKVRSIVFNRQLAAAAAQLMGVKSVRLYHDQALYKAPLGGITPWHCDQYYWPLDTDRTITVWIPLQDTTIDMGSMTFSAGSHHIPIGRDLPIGDDSQQIINDNLNRLGLERVEQNFDAGDVSFHSGWTFHCTGPNATARPRHAMTVIYMENGTRLKAPENANQEADRAAWCPDVAVGDEVATFINPVLFG
ncbi:MAG: phytanoyl-CoA dioxygenase family protein [Halioglobus sp.]|nr:phytanoyl-CoA dioxygenase family protein [Halioglobus sp.]